VLQKLVMVGHPGESEIRAAWNQVLPSGVEVSWEAIYAANQSD